MNIPALEETNCRTQELSLAGRIGLWQVGVCDHWTSRAVTDNACFDRMWEWSSQQVLSTYLRHLIMRAAYGSDIFSIDIHQGPMTEALRSQLLTFYNLMNKGIIPVPEKDEILSISGIWMGIKSPPDKDYITHGINGHNYNYNETTHPQLVFDRLDCYWAGAPLMDYDFSSYAYGVEHRLTNFLPKNPYGLIPIVPDTFNLENYPGFYKRISTDGKYFYDQAGKLYSPSEYKPEALRLLKEGADRLPVRVTGDVAWSVIRMDSTHVRVILIDPGYVNPRQRNAEIHLQHIDGKAAEDILKREKLDIEKGSIKLTIPAGVFRIVDITHGTKPKLTKNKA